METAYFSTPLGVAKIIGDKNGIAEISIGHDVSFTESIPRTLQEAIVEIEEYFEGTRQDS